jgi:hypothetical protein
MHFDPALARDRRGRGLSRADQRPQQPRRPPPQPSGLLLRARGTTHSYSPHYARRFGLSPARGGRSVQLVDKGRAGGRPRHPFPAATRRLTRTSGEPLGPAIRRPADEERPDYPTDHRWLLVPDGTRRLRGLGHHRAAQSVPVQDASGGQRRTCRQITKRERRDSNPRPPA